MAIQPNPLAAITEPCQLMSNDSGPGLKNEEIPKDVVNGNGQIPDLLNGPGHTPNALPMALLHQRMMPRPTLHLSHLSGGYAHEKLQVKARLTTVGNSHS